MKLKKGNYPYPEECVFMVFGGPSEDFLSKNVINVDVESEGESFGSIVDIFNKISVLHIVADNIDLAKQYMMDIMPEWWSLYTITSLKELKSWGHLAHDTMIKDTPNGESWIIKTNNQEKPYITIKTDKHNIDILRTITNEYFGEDSFVFALLASNLTKTISWLQSIKNGKSTEEERFVFNLEDMSEGRNPLEIYLDELYSNMPMEVQSEILKNSLSNGVKK